MADTGPILEAPAPGPLRGHSAKEEPGRPDENPLAVDQIQGNIFPGFLKDFQTLLFLRINDAVAFAQWLEGLLPRIATMEMVVTFNRLHKYIRYQHQSETAAPKITWINVAFSFAGLQKLKPPNVNLEDFQDLAFKAGLLQQSLNGVLGDPVRTGQPGDPDHWLIGGPGNEADVVLIVAGDAPGDLNHEVARLTSTLFSSSDPQGQRVTSGAEMIFRQDGATLPGQLRGHEHFGFRDGISQPGIRGKLPDGTFLTPSQNPRNINQGKPGQDLIWPGEFVFGYPGQDAQDPAKAGADPLEDADRQFAEFARNGSFLVFRRLRQHVGMFHRFLKETADRFKVSPDLVGARMMGRWADGAPAVRSLEAAVPPDQSDPALAHDDCRNNQFQYVAGSLPGPRPPRQHDCRNVTAPPNDPQGLQLPFAGHIRKSFPRNDITGLSESETQTHRLLRRGIPYGEASLSTPHQPVPDHDAVDRGLLFLAYQVSIADQFEFITQNWLNNGDFSQSSAGHDPILGQNPAGNRSFHLKLPGETEAITTDLKWVVPTGGGYFFAPSIHALKTLAGIDPSSAMQTA